MATTKSNEFSVEEKLSSLIYLQKVNSKLDAINIMKGELPLEVSDLEDEIEGLNARKTRIEEEINGIKDFIEERKEAAKEAEALVKKYNKQSNNVKNNREFEAINKEIEMQELEVQLANKKIKDATEDIEEKAKLLDRENEHIKTKNEMLDVKKKELKKIISTSEKEEEEILKLREKAYKKVEERLLNSYEKIRNNYRNGLAVVRVERDACGGCFNAIPPQKQSEIKQKKKILICENCGRILVDDDLFNSIDLK